MPINLDNKNPSKPSIRVNKNRVALGTEYSLPQVIQLSPPQVCPSLFRNIIQSKVVCHKTFHKLDSLKRRQLALSPYSQYVTLWLKFENWKTYDIKTIPLSSLKTVDADLVLPWQ